MPIQNPPPNEPQWPPRSPHEALLGTPGGRERLRRMMSRTSPSPSPTKMRRSKSTMALGSPRGEDLPGFGGKIDGNFDLGDDEDDEDEETLRLKLQEIQARLRLKKLQNAKAQQRAGPTGSDTENDPATRPESAPITGGGIRPQSQLAAARRKELLDRPQSATSIQVPASPVRKAQPAVSEQTSPRRVTLGIDKGLRAKDVSLKRAPSLRRDQSAAGGTGGYLRRTRTPGLGDAQHDPQQEATRPLSFSERLASARTDETTRRDKEEKIQKLRSKTFSIGKEEMERYKSNAVELPDVPYQLPAFSRDDIMASVETPAGPAAGGLQRSNTAPSIRAGAQLTAGQAAPAVKTTVRPKKLPPDQISEEAATSLEPYSSYHLKTRIIPHTVLTRTISSMKIYQVKDLLKHVKAPDWSLPGVEADIVVFAIVASKSEPKSHKPVLGPDGKPKPGTENRGKFMVLRLVDLTYEIELYLFNGGFERFYKVSTGTVVAILNPTIIPPPPGRADTGRFGLVINSDADTILEIGVARDLGYCESRKADGRMCNAWINSRRTQYCEFHTNEAVSRTRQSRVEVNMMDLGGMGRRKHKWREVYLPSAERPRQQAERIEEVAKRGRYDRETGSRYFVSNAQRTAQLMDEGNNYLGRLEREDGLRRKLLEQERERDIARKLGQMGAGAGRDYMRLGAAAADTKSAASGPDAASNGSSTLPSSEQAADASEDSRRTVDVKALGLKWTKGRDLPIHLSPVKRKRPDSALSTSTMGTGTGRSGGSSGLGWGTSLKDKLSRMKSGEKLTGPDGLSGGDGSTGNGNGRTKENENHGTGSGIRRSGETSPVRKKTRFVTEKGIREAGRDSLGGAELLSMQQVALPIDDDNDDELIILK